jgi:DNA-binding XRE family transcriptional regulator
MNANTVRNRLLERLGASSLNYAEAARMSGAPYEHIRRICRHGWEPPLATALSLCQGLELPIEEVFWIE